MNRKEIAGLETPTAIHGYDGAKKEREGTSYGMTNL